MHTCSQLVAFSLYRWGAASRLQYTCFIIFMAACMAADFCNHLKLRSSKKCYMLFEIDGFSCRSRYNLLLLRYEKLTISSSYITLLERTCMHAIYLFHSLALQQTYNLICTICYKNIAKYAC